MHEYTVVRQSIVPVSLLWLIPLFPLIGATINGLFGKKIQDKFGKTAVHTIAIGSMAVSALIALVHFVKLMGLPAESRYLHNFVFPMVDIGSLKINMALAMDPLSGMMALIITIIGSLIHIYSAGYMHEEPAYWRFFCYLNLFVFSMLLLVLGDNFIVMFFGWEGVGLCSYLLIGFWYTDVAKARAGMKAFVVNRIGDFGFVTGVFFLFWGLGGTWQLDGSYTKDLQPVGNVIQARVLEETAAEPGSTTVEHARPAEAHAQRTAVYVGPTLTFREVRNQLALTDAKGVRPVASRLTGKTVWGLPLVFLICL